MKRIIFSLLILCGVGWGQAPAPPIPTGCPVPLTMQDSIACIVFQVNQMQAQVTYDQYVIDAAQNTKIETVNSGLQTVNSNQVGAQKQIDTTIISVNQLLQDTSDLDARVKVLEAKLANLQPGPQIKLTSVVAGTGSATIAWTNYVTGTAVIKWSTVPNAINANSAYTFIPQAGMSFQYTITAPSKTTITFWLQVNISDGTTFTGPKQTIQVL